MRYLKQKISKANEYQKHFQDSELRKEQEDMSSFFEVQIKIEVFCETKTEENIKIEAPCEIKTEETSDHIQKKKSKRSPGNNVMKNYAGAMVSFALSLLAEPYLARCSLIRTMPPQMFRQLLKSKRRKIKSLQSFRELLLIDSQDSEETKTMKILFQEACKVFLKFFCVNWIYNSKLNDKQKYLKYRMKLLRRVQNPEHFTYLETFSTQKSRKRKSKSSAKVKVEKIE